MTRHECQDAFGQQRFLPHGLWTMGDVTTLPLLIPGFLGGRDALGHHPVPNLLRNTERGHMQG